MDRESTTQDNRAKAQERAQGQAPPGATLQVEQGTCYALFAYDVGFSINLDQADRRVTAATTKQRAKMRRKRRAPHYFEYDPPPLHITQATEPVTVGNRNTVDRVDAVIYDFGAISVTYAIPLRGPLTDLLRLSDELWDHPQLEQASRRIVEELLATMGPAVAKPRISKLVEDYSIYQIEQVTPATELDEIIARHAAPLAQILRAEPQTLSEQEVSDALSCRVSYGTQDGVLIDWNAALLFDRDAEDVRAVLEYANVELLELRYLDDQLDNDLDEAYETVTRRRGRLPALLGSWAGDLRRIAALQMDSALLFEGVNNALKLLGDQYLARVYRLASQRLHLTEWDASIIRKLQILEGLYERMSDQQSNRRIEVLEWIIIILIAVSIVLPFVSGVPAL
jgi:hypothetical protein